VIHCRLPLTWTECRARFELAAREAGATVTRHPIAARGPDQQQLGVDSLLLGAASPRRALVVMSGVHGVEGFVGSAIQTDLLRRLEPRSLPPDMAVLMLHAVNPWGMAWSRRQNESNVDLNRNWRRSVTLPTRNDAYDELHALACPDSAELPSLEDLMNSVFALVRSRGVGWVRDGITLGQYRHPDGLHFGGERTEESTAIVEGLVRDRLRVVERLLTIDLHTGHGPRGTLTLLSDQPSESAQTRFLARLGVGTVEATAGNPEATTGLKSGQIANGLAGLFPNADCVSSSAEFGTVPDAEQLSATFLEHWVHRHGNRADPAHAEIVWRYRCCFTPDDRSWESRSLEQGAALLDASLDAVASWDR